MKKNLALFIILLLVFGCETMNKNTNKLSDNGFEKESSHQSREMGKLVYNRYYELVGIKNGNEFVIFEPGHGNAGLLKLNSDSSFEASSGINSGFGKYTYKNAKREFADFMIDSLGVTKMAGPNDQANFFDALFFRTLKLCKYVKVEGKIIKLHDASKNNIMNFYLR